MAMVINSNIMSLNAQRNLTASQGEQNQAMERLSSGKRINSAADDAAGLAISNRMTSQVRGLDQAVRNANDGISLIQTAEGALQESTNILQRMRELSIQSANGIYADGDRESLNAEVEQLKSELTRIAETTTFNGLQILDGSLGDIDLQVGSEANQTIGLSIGEGFSSDKLGASDTTESSGEFTLSQSTKAAESGTAGSLNALNEGDLTINGVAVPQSDLLDLVSTSDNKASALAYAEAINSVSDETGVVASATTEANLGGVTITGSLDLGVLTVTENVPTEESGLTLTAGDLVIDGIDMAGTYGADSGSGPQTFKEKFVTDLNDELANKGSDVRVALDSAGTNLIMTTTATDGVIDINSDGTLSDNVAQISLGAWAPNATNSVTLGAGDLVINGVDLVGADITADMSVAAAVVELNDTIGSQTWEFYEVDATNIGIRSNNGAQEFTVYTDGGLTNGPTIAGIDTSGGADDVATFTTVSLGTGSLATAGTTTPTVALMNFDGGTAIETEVVAAEVTLGAGDLTINDQDITGTFSSQQELADLITASAADTGVTAAIVSNELVLTAADGRNIEIVNDGDVNVSTEDTDKVVFELGNYDLNSASGTVYSGTVTLDGNEIEIGGNDTSGFNTAETISALQQTAMTNPTTQNGTTFETLEDGELLVNGYTVDFDAAGFTGNSLVDDDASAQAIADAINTTAGLKDEVTATATTVMNLGAVSAASADPTFALTINGQTIDIEDSISEGDSNGYLVGKLNAAFADALAPSTSAGLVASVNDDGELLITADDGRNVTVQVENLRDHTESVLGNLDTTTGSNTVAYTTKGTVSLSGDGANVVGDIEGSKSYLAGIERDGDTIAAVDISTQAGAQDAIEVIDRALNQINEARSDLGAANNRLDFTISNLSNVSENTAAARSRIEDADFAAESAALSRAQVLQQAGTAMLAQANAAPQQVLSLLQ